MNDFSIFITRDELRRLAVDGRIEHGEYLYKSGAVDNFMEFEGMISAVVWGTYKYEVSLEIYNDELLGTCTCPDDSEEGLCQHCVATGLYWIAQNKERSKTQQEGKVSKNITADDISSALKDFDWDQIVRFIIERARWEIPFHRNLILQTSFLAKQQVDSEVYKSEFKKAMKMNYDCEDFNPEDVLSGLHEMVDFLDIVRSKGFEEEVVELAEFSLRAIRKSNLIADFGDSIVFLEERLSELCGNDGEED